MNISKAEDLTVNDEYIYLHGDSEITLRVLTTPAMAGEDRFGRPLMRFQARRLDTGEEGAMLYGCGVLPAPIILVGGPRHHETDRPQSVTGSHA